MVCEQVVCIDSVNVAIETKTGGKSRERKDAAQMGDRTGKEKCEWK
jgi:hypothetical protein